MYTVEAWVQHENDQTTPDTSNPCKFTDRVGYFWKIVQEMIADDNIKMLTGEL